MILTTLYQTHLEDSLVDIWQQQDQQVESPDLFLQTIDVRYAGKWLQVLTRQQGNRKFSTHT